MLERRRNLVVHVLVERSAARDVENLNPATHREDRELLFECVLEKCNFNCVAVEVGGAARAVIFFAVARPVRHRRRR